jgi:hypothetical protein
MVRVKENTSRGVKTTPFPATQASTFLATSPALRWAVPRGASAISATLWESVRKKEEKKGKKKRGNDFRKSHTLHM